MSVGHHWWVVAAGLLAACSSAATTTESRREPSGTALAVTGPTPPVDTSRTPGDASSVPVSDPPVRPTTAAPDETIDTTPVPATTENPAEVPTEDLADEPVVDDDPSFELGPEVVLDVDVARFPVDDAGQGSNPATTSPANPDPPGNPDPAEDGDPQGDVAGWAGVDRYLESVLIGHGNTAASVAVAIDGEIVHRSAFGLRDPDSLDPAEPVDRFRIASISKPITAITALQLVEDGVVGLDDPIGRTVADHVGLGPVSPSTNALTLRALLTHRSGFAKFESTFFRSGAVDCADAARQGLSRGTGSGGYVYSNMNYCVAGMLIEALTGLTYEQAAYRYLLTPLGISEMRLAPTIDPGPDEIRHVTTPGRNYMETLGAAGAWIATPSDLVTILDSLDESTPGYKPLDPETVQQMEVPPGARFGQRGYGLGIISYGFGRLGHTGTIEATHAMLLDRGDGVTWAITVAGQSPGESTELERIMNAAFAAGGFVAG